MHNISLNSYWFYNLYSTEVDYIQFYTKTRHNGDLWYSRLHTLYNGSNK